MRVHFKSKKTEKKKVRHLLSVQTLFAGSLPDMGLLYCVLGLMVFGWVMVYSSSALVAESRYHDQYFFLKRQVVWSLIGLVGFVVSSNLSLKFWQGAVKPMYALVLATLVLVLIVGPEISGARRWIRAGGFSFQPSELAKLVMVLAAADYMDRRQSRLQDFKKGLMPLLVLFALMAGLIVIEPDLGTPVLMGLVFLSLLILGGARWKHLMLMALCTLPLLVIAVLKVKYRLMRLFAYLDPWSDAQGAGYQLVQSLLALGSGGIFGQGLGQSKIKISSLPDAHTDFVFAVLGEELGLIGTLVCAALFLFLALRGLKIAKKSSSFFGRLVAAGISLTIGYQAIINMGVASGLFPTKGMPLPFISFGGSSLLILLMSVGILAHISKNAEPPPSSSVKT